MDKKPNISLDQARELARDYIAAQDLRGWRLEVVEVHRAGMDPRNWTVIVDRYSPEGGVVDGPAVLIVDGLPEKCARSSPSMGDCFSP